MISNKLIILSDIFSQGGFYWVISVCLLQNLNGSPLVRILDHLLWRSRFRHCYPIGYRGRGTKHSMVDSKSQILPVHKTGLKRVLIFINEQKYEHLHEIFFRTQKLITYIYVFKNVVKYLQNHRTLSKHTNHSQQSTHSTHITFVPMLILKRQIGLL